MSHRLSKRRSRSVLTPFVMEFCEQLERRVLFDGTIELAPELVEVLNTPRVRTPGQGVQPDPSVIPGPDSPTSSGTIEALNFDDNFNLSGSYFIPPDVIGASGPAHLLNAVNVSIQWYTKAGTQEYSQRLGKNLDGNIAGSFFQSLTPTTSLFDPKVLYDQYNNRFVVVALEQVDTVAVKTSRLLIAVSDDSNPNGTWYYQAVDTKLNIAGVDTWFDYPGFGVDANAMYITGNMFSFGAGTFRGSRLWVFNKAGLYAGGASAFTVYDPSTLAALPSQSFTIQPAHMYGAAPGTVGTFLVASGWNLGANEYISVIRVDNPLGAISFTNTFVDVGDTSSTFTPAAATQLGTGTTIDSGDGRAINAVWRNNLLWFANTISPNSGADAFTATAHWYKFGATNAATTLSDQGNVGAEDLAVGTRSFYPGVAVDSANNLAIGFSASGPSLYPGAYYTGRLAGAPAGTVQSTGTLAAGQDYYNRRFNGSRNRWGDYTGISIDPSDNSTFWLYNEYAISRGTVLAGYPTEDGRWGTRWGKFILGGTGVINGMVYEDRDGSFTFGGTDTAMLGVRIFLDSNNNSVLDSNESSVVSNGTGYSFTGLAAGTYNVREVIPTGYIRTEPVSGVSVLVVAAGTVSANFGNFPIVFTGTSGNDAYYLRSSGANAQIWVGATPPTASTYSIAKALLPSLTFNGGLGDDSLVVDYTLGDPTPTGGVAFNGGAFSITGDTIDVRGTGLADNFSIAVAGTITRGSSTISYAAQRLNLSAGTYGVSADLGGKFVDVTGATSKVNFTQTQNLAALTVGTGGNVVSTSTNAAAPAMIITTVAINGGTLLVSPNGNLSGVSKFKTLSITGSGALNLRNNDLVVDYTSAATPFTSILNYVKTGIPILGFGGTGVGITSTEVQNQTTAGTMFGVIDGATTGGLVTTLSGYTLPNPNTSVLVKYTWRGDSNLSGQVNGSDYALADTGFSGGGSGWFYGDMNYDGFINGSDYALIDTGFSSQNIVL